MSGQRQMVRRPGRSGRTFLALSALALLVVWARAAGTGPDAAASEQDLRAGDRLVLAIHVESARELAAFEAELVFDPAALSLLDARPGRFAPAGSTMLQDERDGAKRSGRMAIGAYNAARETRSGAGELARVDFRVRKDGASEVSLDMASTAAFDRNGRPIAATISLRSTGGPIYLPSLDAFQAGGLAGRY